MGWINIKDLIYIAHGIRFNIIYEIQDLKVCIAIIFFILLLILIYTCFIHSLAENFDTAEFSLFSYSILFLDIDHVSIVKATVSNYTFGF